MIDWTGQDKHRIGINMASKDALLEAVTQRFQAGEGFSVATINLDHVVKLRRSPEFLAAYQSQTFVVADGNPIVWLSRLARRPVALAPGSELIEPLAELAARMNVSVALLGATEDTLDGAEAWLTEKFPGLTVVKKIAPPMGFDPNGPGADAALAEIASSGAGLCFLAMGAPKQEILGARGTVHAPKCGFVSIGAGLDFLSGHQTRAPLWVRKLALEWVWRMASNPRRLAKRYLDCALAMPGLAWDALRARRVKPNV